MAGYLYETYGKGAVGAPKSLEEKFMERGDRIKELEARLAGQVVHAHSTAADALMAEIAAKDKRIANLEADVEALKKGYAGMSQVAVAAIKDSIELRDEAVIESGAAKPWEDLGISRQAWYKRQKKEKGA